jgi:hypothetical protein
MCPEPPAARVFAREDTRTPLTVAARSPAVDPVAILPPTGPPEHAGLTPATAASPPCDAALPAERPWRRSGLVTDRRLRRRLPATVRRTAIIGGVLSGPGHLVADPASLARLGPRVPTGWRATWRPRGVPTPSTAALALSSHETGATMLSAGMRRSPSAATPARRQCSGDISVDGDTQALAGPEEQVR